MAAYRLAARRRGAQSARALASAPHALVTGAALTGLALLLGGAACGPAPPGHPASSVGAQGGAVASPDGGARLRVPPSALAGPVTLTVAPATAGAALPHGPDGPLVLLGPIYRFDPAGTHFETPARVRLPFDADRLPPGVSPRSVRVYWSHGGGPATPLDTSVAPAVGRAYAWVSDLSLGAVGVPQGSPACCAEPTPGGGLTHAQEFGACPPGATEAAAEACEDVCCPPLLGRRGLGLIARGDCVAPDPDYTGEGTPPTAPVTPLPLGQCDVLCCRVGDAFETLSRVACEAAGGDAEGEDPALCEYVCCGGVGSQGGQTMTRGACQAQGVPASEQQDPSQCDRVCCDMGDELQTVTAWRCETAGQGQRPADECVDVCCDAGDVVDTMTRGDCSWEGHEVSAAQCALVCCEQGEVAELLSLGTCQRGGGTGRPAPDCDLVCCQHGAAAPTDEVRATCDAQGGQVVGATECDKICCAHGDQAALQDADACAASGGVEADVDACTTACCLRDGGYAWTSVQGCDDAGGAEVSDGGLCEPVCCQEGDSYRVATGGGCAGAGGTVYAQDPATCTNACCHYGDQWLAVPAAACEAEGGAAVSDETQCAPGCCKVGGGYYDARARGACAGPDDVFDPDAGRCGEVCCAHAGRFDLMVAAVCEEDAQGQPAQDPAACDTVCCQSGTATYGWDKRGACEAGGWTPLSDTTPCQSDLCCELVRGEAREFTLGTLTDCTMQGGTLTTDPTACEPVCCDRDVDGFQVTSAGSCAAPLVGGPDGDVSGGGVVAGDAKSCLCCATNPGGATPTYTTLGPGAEEQCGAAGGALVADPAPCATVCCALGGQTGPDAGPLEVRAQGACEAAGGVAVGDAALCAPTCCHGPGLENHTQEAYACLVAGGVPTAEPGCPVICGDGVCALDKGEDDASCPADCGCAVKPEWLCSTPDAFMRLYGPAPAGCWCDIQCAERPGGCCADQQETCPVTCGDGLCVWMECTETPETCPEDCGPPPEPGPQPPVDSCAFMALHLSFQATCDPECSDGSLQGAGMSCFCCAPMFGNCDDFFDFCGVSPPCGDGVCSMAGGEDCTTCPMDCGTCVCDEACQAGEQNSWCSWMDGGPMQLHSLECVPKACGPPSP